MTSARQLDEALRVLRAEIQALDLGDEDARRRLDSLVLEIAARTKDPAGAAPDAKLTGRVEASILGFEASHPRLAVVLNDVLEKLSAMGI